MKTSAGTPHKAKVYYQKAQRYARAARANHASGDYDPAMSNAINAVINLVDAVCIQASGARSASGNHGDAIRLLVGQKDVDAKLRDALGKRLTSLLSVKNLAQYEGALITRSQSDDAVKDMERAFAAVATLVKKSEWA